MQISDEMLDRADMAFRLSSADRKGALRAALEYALSALSLPVQPVAWPEGFFKLGGDNRLRECASDGCHQHVSVRVERSGVGSDHCEPCARKIADLLTTPPVPPTKPEDDLRAAREAAEDIEINYVVCDPKEVREQVAAAIVDALRKDRALRSRPLGAAVSGLSTSQPNNQPKERTMPKLTSKIALELVERIERLNDQITAVYREAGEFDGMNNINAIREIVKAREDARDQACIAEGSLAALDENEEP